MCGHGRPRWLLPYPDHGDGDRGDQEWNRETEVVSSDPSDLKAPAAQDRTKDRAQPPDADRPTGAGRPKFGRVNADDQVVQGDLLTADPEPGCCDQHEDGRPVRPARREPKTDGDAGREHGQKYAA